MRFLNYIVAIIFKRLKRVIHFYFGLIYGISLAKNDRRQSQKR
jgi:hypothetical protein